MPSIVYGTLISLLLCQVSLVAQTPDHDAVQPSGRQRSPARQAQTYLALAKQHIRAGRTAEAQHLLSQAIAAQHTLSEAYLLRADLKRAGEDLIGAIVDYSVVVYQQPEHYEARFQRATTQYEAQRYQAAREDFHHLLAHPPGETNTLYFKGETSPGETSPGEASREAFVATAATTLQSDMKADLLNYIGLCYWHMHDYVRASAYFRQATAHRPEEPMAYVNLGLTYEATGDTLRAIDFYRQALEKAPDHSVALRNLSALARQLNDTTLEKEVLSQPSSSYEALLQQGMYAQRQGDYEAAIRSFSQALEQTPSQAEVLIQRGFAYEKALRPSEALRDYTQAIRLNPQAEKAYSNRGNIYFRQQAYDRALADYNQALALEPNNATAWYNRGLTHHRLGHQAAACQDLQQAVTLGNVAAEKPLATLCGNTQ